MQKHCLTAVALAACLSACSPGGTVGSKSAFSPTGAPDNLSRATAKPKLISPSYLYIESEGSGDNFEVIGRTAKNESKWSSKTNCKKKVSIIFNSYNAQGSSYTAYGNVGPAECQYTVTNPKGQKATMSIQVSSD
jgi:hypothetical protein